MSLGRAEWLHAQRARGWCSILAVLLLIWLAVWLGTSHHGLDRTGDPMAADFLVFWTSAEQALHGHAAAAYDPVSMYTYQQAEMTVKQPGFYPMFYPPGFLLLYSPIALLPYLGALLVFLAAGFVPLVIALRRLLPQPWGWLPILSFPGMLVTAGTGQNGFLTAACFAGYTVLLDKFPFLAGACLGALTCKPHLALLAPVCMLAARRWRAFAGSAVTAIALSAASWLVFGTATWRAFFAAMPQARLMLERGEQDASKMQSMFGAMRVLHLGTTIGYGAQALVSLLAFVLLAKGAWRRPGGHAEGALLTIAALNFTPHLLDYDLASLSVPLAWLLSEAPRDGWRPWEKYVGLAAFMLPIIGRGIAHTYGIPLAPLILIGLLLVVARRAGNLAA